MYDPPEFLHAVAKSFFPLGGFLNILVYTRPKVAVFRRTHPICSLVRDFWLVLDGGGEIPKEEHFDLSISCCQTCCRAPL